MKKSTCPILIGEECIITFIDDFSRFSYVYLIKEDYDALHVFKIFKVEVEKSRSGIRWGGEHYERRTESVVIYAQLLDL